MARAHGQHDEPESNTDGGNESGSAYRQDGVEEIARLLEQTTPASSAAPNEDRNQVWEDLMAHPNPPGSQHPSYEETFEAALARIDQGAAPRDVPLPESLDAARAGLAAEFPGVDFEVSARPAKWGQWLMVKWEDGPTETDVSSVALRYVGMHEVDGEVLTYDPYSMSVRRTYTDARRAWAMQQWEAAGITRDPEDDGFVLGLPEGESEQTVAGCTLSVKSSMSLEALARALLAATRF